MLPGLTALTLAALTTLCPTPARVVLPPRTMSVTVTNGWGVRCGFSYSVQPDTRALMLVYPTNKKVPALDANGNPTTDANGDPNYTTAPNVADADGTMHGDTLYSYYMLSTGNKGGAVSPVPIVNQVNFTPQFLGGWHYKIGDVSLITGVGTLVPDVVDPDTWSWSLPESDDQWDQGIWKMPYA